MAGAAPANELALYQAPVDTEIMTIDSDGDADAYLDIPSALRDAAGRVRLGSSITVTALDVPSSCDTRSIEFEVDDTNWPDRRLPSLRTGESGTIVMPRDAQVRGRPEVELDQEDDDDDDSCRGARFRITFDVGPSSSGGGGNCTGGPRLSISKTNDVRIGQRVTVFGRCFSATGGNVTLSWGDQLLRTVAASASFRTSFVIRDFPQRNSGACTGTLSVAQGGSSSLTRAINGDIEYYVYLARGVTVGGRPVLNGSAICEGQGRLRFARPHVWVAQEDPDDDNDDDDDDDGLEIRSSYGPVDLDDVYFGLRGGIELSVAPGQRVRITPAARFESLRRNASMYSTVTRQPVQNISAALIPGRRFTGRLYFQQSTVVNGSSRLARATIFGERDLTFSGAVRGRGRIAAKGDIRFSGRLDLDELRDVSVCADGDLILP
jgi:hypothetical protein